MCFGEGWVQDTLHYFYYCPYLCVAYDITCWYLFLLNVTMLENPRLSHGMLAMVAHGLLHELTIPNGVFFKFLIEKGLCSKFVQNKQP